MYPSEVAGALHAVASSRNDRIQEAVLRALARPAALGGAALACLLATTSAGLLAGLLSALAAWFGLAVAGLYLQGEAVLPDLTEEREALPPAAVDPSPKSPLPEGLRNRYRDLHVRVERLATALPEDLPIEASELELLPEKFRELARRRARIDDGVPAAVGLDAELARIEALVTRVEGLAGRGDPGREVAAVLDELEAVLEIAEDTLPP